MSIESGQLYVAWRKFRRSKAGLLGFFLIASVCLIAIFATVIYPSNPAKINPEEKFLPPSKEHLFGTDHLGRDVFGYVVWGARTSLAVGLGAIIIETMIALIVGAIAGYYGGVVGQILMRITEIILVLPIIVLLIVAVSMFEVRSYFLIMVIMGLLSWPWMARVVRSSILSVKEALYVESAQSLGASDFRIIFRHILPNSLSPIIVFSSMDLAWAILYQATLTFLGLGDPTAVAWGTLINVGMNYMQSHWWISTMPALMIFWTVLGFNLLGDALRDAFDIKTR